jgi:hypothetical protein
MLEYQGRWRDTVIIVCLTRLVAIYDVSQFDYFRHLASAANTTAAAPPIWPRSERPLLPRRMICRGRATEPADSPGA